MFTKKEISISNSENDEIKLQVDIANNFLSKSLGAMGRSSLDEGILFAFEKSTKPILWNFNVKIPLDIISFDSKGFVVDILDMTPAGLNPLRIETKTPKKNCKYLLEVPKGFVNKNKIKIRNSSLNIQSIYPLE